MTNFSRCRSTVECLLRLCVALLVMAMPAQLHADYLYTFSGVIEAGQGADINHSQISEGESWEANFIIDSSNPGNGSGAVVSGELTFSGGYESPLDYSGLDVVVADNFAPVGGGIFDFIRISNGFEQIFQANTSNFNTLENSLLPEPGLSFASAPNPININFGAFDFEDSNGFVRYDASQINNVVFTASAIPEPSSLAVLSSLFGLMSLRRRK